MNRLYEIYDGGATHFIIAKNKKRAFVLAYEHIHLRCEIPEDEFDLEVNRADADKEYEFFCDASPIKLTGREWEMIYREVNHALYVACSEY